MLELLVAFLLVHFEASWGWWVGFAIMIMIDIWMECQKYEW